MFNRLPEFSKVLTEFLWKNLWLDKLGKICRVPFWRLAVRTSVSGPPGRPARHLFSPVFGNVVDCGPCCLFSFFFLAKKSIKYLRDSVFLRVAIGKKFRNMVHKSFKIKILGLVQGRFIRASKRWLSRKDLVK